MAEELEQVLSRAAGIVTPTKEEHELLSKTERKVQALIQDTFSKEKIVPDIFVGGSYAKGTWLKGEADIDFYLLYPPDYPREKLESEAIPLAKKTLEGYEIKMRFAEHPYVEAFVGKTRVNVVPCYRVEKGNWQSAADRSPYHTEYVQDKFDEDLQREARLLKKFAKSAGVYGAEVRIRGFSGYVCEVLTLKFGSFTSVLKEISSNTKQSMVISTEPYDEDFVKTAFSSPLVILDPIDTKRNLGTAISPANVGRMTIRGRDFLSRPSLEFFSGKLKEIKPSIQTRQALLSKTVVLRFQNSPRSVDILWGELRKSIGALKSKLEHEGFVVLREQVASDEKGESAFLFLFLNSEVEGIYERKGPEYFRPEEVESYVSKNKTKALISWIDEEEGRVTSLFSRNPHSTNAISYLKYMLSDKERTSRIGLSRAVREEISRKFVLSDGRASFRSKKWLEDAINSIVSGEGVLGNSAGRK